MSPRRVAVVVGLSLSATLLSVPSSTSAPPAPTSVREASAAAASPIDWKPCRDGFLAASKAQCGMLEVPLDHADPTGPTIQVAVSRVKATRMPYRGAIFTNPGGPGGSGTFMAALGQYVPGRVGATYDWYGMDPRGIGASRPALTCDGRFFRWDSPDYKPRSARLVRYWTRRSASYAESCGDAAARRLLPHVRTEDTVADFEVLRQRVGAEKVTFYGASYGTYIAQVYATLHPERIKAMVLDGVLDPREVFYDSNLRQDRAFETTMNRFFAWVGRFDSVYHLGRDRAAVRGSYTRLRRTVGREPAAGKVGPNELDGALLIAGYYNLSWPEAAAAFAALRNDGDSRGVRSLYRDFFPFGDDNANAMYLATQCTDAPWPGDMATWLRDGYRIALVAPFLSWANMWLNMPCRTWPVPAGPRIEVTGSGVDAPILLLSERLDAATPYRGALAVRRNFKSSRLVVGVGGTSHAVSLFGVACSDNAFAALLRDGSLPPRRSGNRADKKCPPLAAPVPAATVGRPVLERPLVPVVRW